MEGLVRKYLLAIAVLVSSLLPLENASALTEGKKVALVIGNSAYVHAVTLPNPVRDGKLIAETLRTAGFSVIEGLDLNKVDMGRVLDEFTEAAYDADIAVVYYAGHGLQVDGHNYLIPVDAELQKAAQLQTRTIPVEDVLAALPADPAVGVIILDACRDNPLARTLAAALPKSRSASMGSGLAPVQANGATSGSGGLLIAYATDPGAVAYDGQGTHSPYTAALAKHLITPGLEIQSALTRVRAEVAEETAGAQRPWHNASLAREVFIGGAAPEAKPAIPDPVAGVPTTPSTDGSEVGWTVEQKLWDEASKRNTIAHYELYLSEFPQGKFAAVARLNLDQLKEVEANAPATAATDTQGEMKIASASQSRTAVAVPDDIKLTPGTAETEALLNLDKKARIDLQMRLSALGHSTGGYDGSLGPRSRSAIAAWQKQSSIVESGYLTSQQHMFLIVQTDPLMPAVRAQYEAEQAAARKAAAANVQKQKVANTTTKTKKQQTANTSTKKRVVAQDNGSTAQYRPRGQSNGNDAAVGAFVGGALLGTAIGAAIGN